MTAPDLEALRVYADTLRHAGDAVADAADLLAAGGEPTHAASALNLSAVNAATIALGLARRVGQLEVTP